MQFLIYMKEKREVDMIHPSTRLVYIDAHIGYGIVASELIPRGTITYVKDELEICLSPRQFEALSAVLQAQAEKYSYMDARGTRIMSWDIAKYVNHSCTANTMSTGWGFEIALRDILPGEEITDEYGLFNMDYDFPLSCGEPECRQILRTNDIDTYGREWDRSIKNALAMFNHVDQPLLEFLDRRSLNGLMRFINTGKGYKSVKSLKIKPRARSEAAVHSEVG